MTRWTTILALTTILGLALAGCGNGSPEAPSGGGEEGKGAPAMTAPPIPVPEATYEVGCGLCTFGMDVGGCVTAAKVGEEHFVVDGPGVPDAHKTGLCAPEPKQAVVAGQVKDGTLHATKFVVSE